MVRQKLFQTPISIYRWFFQVVVLLGLAGIVVWLSLIPKSPSCIVAGLSLPAFDSSSSSMHRDEADGNASTVLDLEIFNPNNAMGIYYGKIYLTLFSGGVVSGVNSTPAFYQGHNKTASREVQIAANQRFSEGISTENVSFTIDLGTEVQYRILLWKTQHHLMNLRICRSSSISPSLAVQINLMLHLGLCYTSPS